MCKVYNYNNKDRIDTKKKINKHNLKIKSLINALSLKLGISNNVVISQVEPYLNSTPQVRPYGACKQTSINLCAIPKYFVNKPKIKVKKDEDLIIFTFPVVSFAPEVNNAKTQLILNKDTSIEAPSFKNNKNLLALFQLNVVVNMKSGDYKISLHQNCFEKNERQALFVGRCELGQTHNTKHEPVQKTFHIHTPTDENIDTTFNKSLIGGIYHCNPEVYSNNKNLPLEVGIHLALKKFNIKNDIDDAIDIGRYKTIEFLDSSCGKEWTENLNKEKAETINFNQTRTILDVSKKIKIPQSSIAFFVNSEI